MIDQRYDRAGWHAARAGKITASNFRRVMVGKDKALRTLAREIAQHAVAVAAGEDVDARLANVPAIRWGYENEAEAAAHYVLETGEDVEDGGFHVWEKHPLVGASPDRLLGSDGVLEIKNPFNSAQHHTYGNGPGNAVWQCQGHLLVLDRGRSVFMSYDPREKMALRSYIHRLPRDPEMIDALGKKLIFFAEEYLRPTLDFFEVEVAA